MLYFDFARILEIKAIKRPFSHLLSLGYSSGYAAKITKNRISEINLDRLEKFCRDFNCTPNDVIGFKPNKNDTIPADHALNTIIKKELSNEINVLINALPVEKIQQIHDIIKNMD